ncbi:MAG: prepilin peptidase [Clostridia bacterium]|nr:prepilin peptidase [Clostridia bacterium]
MSEAWATGRLLVLLLAVAWAGAVDLRRRIIPNGLNLAAFAVLLALRLGEGASQAAASRGLWAPLAAGVLGGAALGGAMLALHVVTRGALGMGDVKLAGVIGTGLGLRLGLVALFLAFVVGALVSLVLLGLGRARLRDRLPFGPAMAVGTWLAALWGGPIGRWLFG